MIICLAIVGSRELSDKKWFEEKMDEVVKRWGIPNSVVSGGGRGADTLGEKWAKERNIKTLIFKPDWNKHGRSAGIIRNGDIIGAATHVVAFPSRNGSGTQNSISRSKKAGLHLIVHMID